MTIPRCSVCGKISVNKKCIKCIREEKHKKVIFVRCITCGLRTTITVERYEHEPYKCMKCR